MRFILFLNRQDAGQLKRKRLNCLNAELLKRSGCLSPDNAATPAKEREVDLLQWALDPVAPVPDGPLCAGTPYTARGAEEKNAESDVYLPDSR
jgi:hypothetical protein